MQRSEAARAGLQPATDTSQEEAPATERAHHDRLRIVQMGPTQPLGGVAAVVGQLSAELARQGHEVLVLGDGTRSLEAALEAGVRYEEFRFGSHLPTLVRQLRRLKRLLDDFAPHVVHVHGRSQALMLRLIGRHADWFTLHNTHLTDQVAWYDRGWIRRVLSPLGRRVFVLNDEAARYMQRELLFDPSRIETVSNGIDCQRFAPVSDSERAALRQSFGASSGELLAIFVGRFHEQKNPQAILQLAERTRAEALATRFLMMGDGPLDGELRQQIESRDLGPWVQLLDYADPLPLYRAADLLLMPSRYEGYGLVGAEALACGTPILRTRTGGWDEMVLEGSTGWVCEPNDDAAFVEAGLRALRERESLGRLRPLCRDHAVHHLGLVSQAERTVRAYERGLA